MAGRPSGQQKSTLMKGAVTVLFGFGCKFEHIQFNTSAITSLLPRRNAQLHKKKQRVIRKRITLCFLVKPFLHKFGVNVVSNQPNRVDKRRGINAF
jgi:hypothetical protein